MPENGIRETSRNFCTGFIGGLLRTVTVTEFLKEHPPEAGLHYLHSGSWVDHSMVRWIGSHAKNKLWQMLLAARRMLEEVRGKVTAEQLQRARENLMIAEGSDYTWWVDSMPYYLAAPFEALFRKQLVNVCLQRIGTCSACGTGASGY